jgi:hypothetical protein
LAAALRPIGEGIGRRIDRALRHKHGGERQILPLFNGYSIPGSAGGNVGLALVD